MPFPSRARFRNQIAAFVQRHADVKRRRRVPLSDEAKTSVFVFLCLHHLLGLDPFSEIVPQASGRGFADYELWHRGHCVGCRVEVKKFEATLKPEHIKKYLVWSGRQDKNFRVGVLTNLREWHIYGYMPGVATREPVRLLKLGAHRPGDLRRLEAHVGVGSMRGRFKVLRRLYGEAREVCVAFVSSPNTFNLVAASIRRRLRTYKRVPFVPNNSGLNLAAWSVVNGCHWPGRNESGLTYKEMRNALCSDEFAEQMALLLRRRVGAPVGKNAVKRNLREWIDQHRYE